MVVMVVGGREGVRLDERRRGLSGLLQFNFFQRSFLLRGLGFQEKISFLNSDIIENIQLNNNYFFNY